MEKKKLSLIKDFSLKYRLYLPYHRFIYFAFVPTVLELD